MPRRYQKKFNRAGKKVIGRGRFNNYKAGGTQLYNDVMYLKSIINSELGQYTTTLTSLTIPASGGITHLAPIPQGDGNFNRSGDSILPKFLNAKLCINQPNAGSVDSVRLIFFLWKDSTVPLVADILENVNPFSHYNVYNKGMGRDRDFKVLSDRTYSLHGGTEKEQVIVKSDMKLNAVGVPQPVHIRYEGTSFSSPHNSLWLARVGTLASNFSELTGSINFRFYDN